MPNQIHDDLPARITDNLAYISIFYLIKLLFTKLIDEDYFRNGQLIAQWIRTGTRYLMKTYNWVFKTQVAIETALMFVAAYQHTFLEE